jgi:hypothetical protein
MQFLCRYSKQSNIQATKNSKGLIWSQLTSLFFSKATVFSNVEPEVASTHQVDNQIQVISVFKCVVHIDQESVADGKFEFCLTGGKAS